MQAKDEQIESIREQLETVKAAYEKMQAEVECGADDRDGSSDDDGDGGGGDDDDDGGGGGGGGDGGDGASSSRQTRSWTRNYKKYYEQLKECVGLREDRTSVPTRSFEGDASKPNAERMWSQLSVSHLRAVLHERADTTSGLQNEHAALEKEGIIEKLLDMPQIRRKLAREADKLVQAHWSTRLAIHIWDRLDLSRRHFDTLRHLLSFIYDAESDTYMPIKVWQNENDPTDFVVAATLASPKSREKLYKELVADCEITVDSKGNCQRDTVKACELLYSNYHAALRKNYSAHRSAMPVLYLDGTGASLGKGSLHAELGSADFVGECKQSRSTMQPLAAAEGDDHSVSQRENLDYVFQTFNKLVEVGEIVRDDGAILPALPLTAADMQGAKASYMQSPCSQPTWCKCKPGASQQHCYPTAEIDLTDVEAAYDEMIAYCEETVGCEMKVFNEMCSAAHYSPGVARGGAFTRFTCPCCGYKPASERLWRQDVDTFHALADDEQKAARSAHNEVGADEIKYDRHYYQLLYTQPRPKLDMLHAGVDMLHLVYLNLFKRLFRYTIHDDLPDM